MKLSAILAPAVAGIIATISIGANASTVVGLSLPTQNIERWYREGPELKHELEKAGFPVELYYGGDGTPELQDRQLKRMIKDDKVGVLIVVPIDSEALKDSLEMAKQSKVPVISYDRLIMGSDAVSYYVGFNSIEAGRMQARSIVKALGLGYRDEPASIEIFSGPMEDSNSMFFHRGMMEILGPYLEDGQLVVPSGQIEMKDTAIKGWSYDRSLKRMASLISSMGYGPKGRRLDAVYSASDSLSDGIVRALKNDGYKAGDMPYITGQDAALPQLRGIAKGERGSTVLKDPRAAYPVIVQMVDAISKNSNPPVNDTTNYDNGTGPVKAYLCKPKLIEKRNLMESFIMSGRYKRSDIFG
ncbi:MAG: sugar-binding protein [Succinivibrio sp.]